MNDNLLLIQTDQRCRHSTDGEHTGKWEPCMPEWEQRVLVHTARFTCRKCGYRMIVTAAGFMPGDIIPEAFRR